MATNMADDMSKFEYSVQKVRVTDASSMLRSTTSRDMPQYIIDVVNSNNSLVDKWEDTLLSTLADDNGMVLASEVWDSWKIFIEGHNALTLYKYLDMFVNLTKEQIAFWKEFLQLDIELLHGYGSGAVNQALNTIDTEVRRRITQEKWEKVYSKTDDPHEWYKEAKVNKHLFFEDENEHYIWPLGVYKDIKIKVQTIVDNPIQPISSESHQYFSPSSIKPYLKSKVYNNMSPYKRAVMIENNNLVDEFYDHAIFPNLEVFMTEYNDKITLELLTELWYVYNEGVNINNMKHFFGYHIDLTADQLEFWRKFMLEHTVTELNNYGSGFVYKAWTMIDSYVRVYFAKYKFDHIYSQSTNPYEWYQTQKKLKGQKPFVHPVWGDQYSLVHEKVLAILNHPVKP